jgi:hypothetical protein
MIEDKFKGLDVVVKAEGVFLIFESPGGNGHPQSRHAGR